MYVILYTNTIIAMAVLKSRNRTCSQNRLLVLAQLLMSIPTPFIANANAHAHAHAHAHVSS